MAPIGSIAVSENRGGGRRGVACGHAGPAMVCARFPWAWGNRGWVWAGKCIIHGPCSMAHGPDAHVSMYMYIQHKQYIQTQYIDVHGIRAISKTYFLSLHCDTHFNTVQYGSRANTISSSTSLAVAAPSATCAAAASHGTSVCAVQQH